jgi:Protein of unknown function (DUF2971)
MNINYVPPTFVEHLKAEPPEVLYHYTGQCGLLGIIDKSELHATKVQYMNDATEFSLALSMAREILDATRVFPISDNIYISSKSNVTPSSTLRGSLTGLEDINIFAACFCKDGDLLSQWRGYAEAAGGCSMGFDSHALNEVASRDGFTLDKCIYDTATQRKIVTEAIEHCVQEELAGRAHWGGHGPLADILFRCGAFFKDKSFENENEWRLVSPKIDFRHDRLSFRAGRSMVTPYYKLPIKHGETLPIQHVIIGPCPHMELAQSAVTALLMQHGMYGPSQGQQIVVGSRIPFQNR